MSRLSLPPDPIQRSGESTPMHLYITGYARAKHDVAWALREHAQRRRKDADAHDRQSDGWRIRNDMADLTDAYADEIDPDTKEADDE